jgi:hypothetical protein
VLPVGDVTALTEFGMQTPSRNGGKVCLSQNAVQWNSRVYQVATIGREKLVHSRA